jgi:hypothetical protein
MKTFKEFNQKEPINEVLGTLAALGLGAGALAAGLHKMGWLKPIASKTGEIVGGLAGGIARGISGSKGHDGRHGYADIKAAKDEAERVGYERSKAEQKERERAEVEQKAQDHEKINTHARKLGFDPTKQSSMKHYHHYMAIAHNPARHPMLGLDQHPTGRAAIARRSSSGSFHSSTHFAGTTDADAEPQTREQHQEALELWRKHFPHFAT